MIKRMIGFVLVFLMLGSSAFAESVVINTPEGVAVKLYRPISVRKLQESAAGTEYIIADDDSDEMGYVIPLTSIETDAGRMMSFTLNGRKIEAAPGSQTANDLSNLLAEYGY